MGKEDIIEKSFRNVIQYLIKSDYSGFDPYDGANSQLTLINNNKYGRFISTYLNKFSPFNLRYLFKIPVSKQNQALAFIGRAMIKDYKTYKEQIKYIADCLAQDTLIKSYGYHCWDAHGIPLQVRFAYKPVGKTDIVGNDAIGRFFFELYKADPKEQYKEFFISVCELFQSQLKTNWNQKHFYRYTPHTLKHNWCYNASAIGASYVEMVSKSFLPDYDKTFTSQCLKDIIEHQKPEGHWYYSLNLDTGYEKPQVDFHQGFVLDAILDHMLLYGLEEPFLSSYKKGLEFYYQKQFLPNGQGIYRYPRKWPVNIHNQAQGIITFTRAAAAGIGEEYHQFARTIAQWTIQNMQDKDGHFYFLKYPLFTNKIPYIRWSDAAMAYALAVLLEYEKKLQHQNA